MEMATTFNIKKSFSIGLCKTVAKPLIRFSTEELNFLKSYNACRLIVLDKGPGFDHLALVRSWDDLLEGVQ